MVSNMASSTGDQLIYDSNTPGGFRFLNHASSTTTINKINSAPWDFVALQGQSQETSLTESQMSVEVYPYVSQLVFNIRNNDSCTQPLFFMTWGRKNGDTPNCPIRPWVCTYEDMDDVIKQTYIKLAKDNHSQISSVGAVWRFLRTNYPSIELYAPDGSHPSLAGSYVVACAFYTSIFKKDPTLVSYNAALDSTTANMIKLAVKQIIYDMADDWDFTAYFNYTINDNSVDFNYPLSVDYINWDFGDGTTSNLLNPNHSYSTTGSYNVTLTITSCGKTIQYTQPIDLTTLTLDPLNEQNISIYPNPSTKFIKIKGFDNELKEVAIKDITGKTLLIKKMMADHSIDISLFMSGTYLLEIKYKNQKFYKKIIKL